MNPERTSSQRPRTGRPGLYRRLDPVIEWLEADRSRLQRRLVSLGAGMGLVLAMLAGVAWAANAAPVAYVVLVASGLVAVRFVTVRFRAAPSQSKREIVARFARALGPRFTASPDEGPLEMDTVDGGLFVASRASRRANHLRGRVGTASVEVCEVRANAVFEGLYVVAEFPNSLRTATFVRPSSDGPRPVRPGSARSASMGSGSMGSGSARANLGQSGSGQSDSSPEGVRKLRLEDGPFARLFEVYAEDPVEAQYVLSVRLLETLAEFGETTGFETNVSFVGRRVQIFVHRPGLYGPVFARALLATLDLAVGLIRDLEANAYVWNRDALEPRAVGPEVIEFALHTTQERDPTAAPRYRRPDPAHWANLEPDEAAWIGLEPTRVGTGED
jgi:Protein of unknown function (DUF3137)